MAGSRASAREILHPHSVTNLLMSSTRNRTWIANNSTGSIRNKWSTSIDDFHPSSIDLVDWTSTDVIGDPSRGDHPFTLIKREDGVIPMSGYRKSGTVEQWVTNYRWCSLRALNPGLNHQNQFPAPSVADFQKVVARSNPSRPSYVPLEIVQDIVDLPKMLKEAFHLFKKPPKKLSIRDLANQNLAAQFGWIPLIKDLHDMLDFQERVAGRARELHRLYDQGGTHTTVHLDSRTGFSETPSYGIPYGSFLTLPGFSVKTETRTYAKKWGSARWKPTALPPYRPTDVEIIRKAKETVLGIGFEGFTKGVWELIPWSFMADWFLGTGNFMLQHSLTVPATCVSVCVMQEHDTVQRFTRTDNIVEITGGGGARYLTTKERFVSPVTLFSALPHIGVNDLSILGSLFIQRFIKG